MRPSDLKKVLPYAVVNAGVGVALGSVNRDAILALYKRFGAVLLKGFDSDLDDFGAFASSFCSVAVQNGSLNRARLGASEAIQSVNLGIQPFPLHPELSREPWKPDSCFFYCIKPPVSGGATTVCDGVEIVRQLPEDIRVMMEGARLKYIAPAGPDILKFWLGDPLPDSRLISNPPPNCPYSFERSGGQLVRVFTRPFLHKPMFSGSLAFGSFLLFARILRGIRTFPILDDGQIVPDDWVRIVRAISDQLTFPIFWERGDVLMLDNSRFMHGRTAVTDPEDRLIATYFGYLDRAIPDDEEPPNAIWRKPGFHPPQFGA